MRALICARSIQKRILHNRNGEKAARELHAAFHFLYFVHSGIKRARKEFFERKKKKNAFTIMGESFNI